MLRSLGHVLFQKFEALTKKFWKYKIYFKKSFAWVTGMKELISGCKNDTWFLPFFDLFSNMMDWKNVLSPKSYLTSIITVALFPHFFAIASNCLQLLQFWELVSQTWSRDSWGLCYLLTNLHVTTWFPWTNYKRCANK